jgi:FKBP-type peptidyl-prolyl cis-trans isomerase SlyD
MKRISPYLFIAPVILFTAGISLAKPKGPAVEQGREVTIDYTMSVEGNVLDSTSGRGPAHYTQGKDDILPALSKNLEGMHSGDEKTVVLGPDDAYGKVNPEAVKEIPRTAFPAGITLAPGAFLPITAPNGKTFPVRVLQVKPESVVVDFNHPLAGKTVSFHIKIVSIK